MSTAAPLEKCHHDFAWCCEQEAGRLLFIPTTCNILTQVLDHHIAKLTHCSSQLPALTTQLYIEYYNEIKTIIDNLEKMLFERRKSSSSNNTSTANESLNSAGATARKCLSEKKLRTPCYCEENVWRLVYRRLNGSVADGNKSNGGKENDEYYVVFISNEERSVPHFWLYQYDIVLVFDRSITCVSCCRCCPMFNQIASDSPMKPCFWDYHVILIQSSKVVKKGKSLLQAQVLDMDSSLSFPCELQEYIDGTFKLEFSNKDEEKLYAPKFRLIRAETYLQNFYSDRMHMRRKDGTWLAKPPGYDCITTNNMTKDVKGYLSNLQDYISIGEKQKSSSTFGDIYTLEQLRAKFGLKK